MCKKQILLASTNQNKLAELSAIASNFAVDVLSPLELAVSRSLPPIPEVQEVGSSYEENALIKAKAFAAWSALPTLADDSGLEVDALDGGPGIYSARYAGSDSEKIQRLLQELRQREALTEASRQARFVCVLALVGLTNEPIYSRGELNGYVLDSPRGTGGFGYDPIIYIYDFGATLAEVDFSLTCSRGFRAQAVHKLFRGIP